MNGDVLFDLLATGLIREQPCSKDDASYQHSGAEPEPRVHSFDEGNTGAFERGRSGSVASTVRVLGRRGCCDGPSSGCFVVV